MKKIIMKLGSRGVVGLICIILSFTVIPIGLISVFGWKGLLLLLILWIVLFHDIGKVFFNSKSLYIKYSTHISITLLMLALVLLLIFSTLNVST